MANTNFSYLRPKFSSSQMAAATGDPTIYDKAAKLYLQTAPSRYQTALQLDSLVRSEAESQKNRDFTASENALNRAQQKAISDAQLNLSTQQLGAQMAAYDKSQPTVGGTIAKAGMLGLTQLDKITKGADWLSDKVKGWNWGSGGGSGVFGFPTSDWSFPSSWTGRYSTPATLADAYYSASTPQDYRALMDMGNPASFFSFLGD